MTSCFSTSSCGATLLPQVALWGSSVASFTQHTLCAMNSKLASITPSVSQHKAKCNFPHRASWLNKLTMALPANTMGRPARTELPPSLAGLLGWNMWHWIRCHWDPPLWRSWAATTARHVEAGIQGEAIVRSSKIFLSFSSPPPPSLFHALFSDRTLISLPIQTLILF